MGKENRLRVLILSRTPQLSSIRRLVEETARAGHHAQVLDPADPELPKAVADVVIPRFGTWKFEESLAALEFFERRRVPVLNRVAPLREARNKWFSYLTLREDDLPVPRSNLAFKKDLPKTYPYVAKFLEGAKGAGVYLISGPQDLMKLPPTEEWLVQDFVAEARGRDHRLIVLDGEVIAAMERQAAEGDFRSNLACGGRAFAYEPTELEKTLAKQATKSMGLRLAGVDLLPSREGPLVLEVNGSPGLEGIEQASGVNVAAAIIASAVKLAEPK